MSRYKIALRWAEHNLKRLQEARGAFGRQTEDEAMFENIHSALFFVSELLPKRVQLLQEHDRHWSVVLGDNMSVPIDNLHIEVRPGGRHRVVFDVREETADGLRSRFEVPHVPAAIEASDAIVRATHALAGSAIEMTHVLKKLAEKL
jgi:hypothetical protein